MSYLYYCIYKIIERHPNLGSPSILSALVLSMITLCCLYLTGFTIETVSGIQDKTYTGPIRANAIITILALVGLFYLYFSIMGKGEKILKKNKRKKLTKLDLFVGYGLASFPALAPLAVAAFMVLITKLGWREMSP